ncbi:hypothetical protein, partial [Streptomyces clavuligerus]
AEAPGRGINISGVDFWHAVEFSRNGRFLQALFTRPSGQFPFGVFKPYQAFSGFLTTLPAAWQSDDPEETEARWFARLPVDSMSCWTLAGL